LTGDKIVKHQHTFSYIDFPSLKNYNQAPPIRKILKLNKYTSQTPGSREVTAGIKEERRASGTLIMA
jgi:hypothetical protein